MAEATASVSFVVATGAGSTVVTTSVVVSSVGAGGVAAWVIRRAKPSEPESL